MRLTPLKTPAPLASAVVLLGSALLARAAKFADSYSARDFTLEAIYDDAAKETAFTLKSTLSGSAYGWHGIGTGQQMAGATVVISWVDSSGKVVVSNRQAVGEFMPQVSTPLQLPAISVAAAQTTSESSGTTVSWTQPGFPEEGATLNDVNMIWAFNADGPSSSSSDAMLQYHQYRGFINLDLTKPYTGGTVTSSGTSTSSDDVGGRGMTKRNMIVWAHMIIGIVAWLLVLPAGVFIGRFGRTKFRWFPKHRAVQTVGILLVLVAMFLGFGTIWCLGADAQSRHLTLPHHKLGLALGVLAVFQGLLGQFGHMLWHAKAIRIQNYLHIVIGIVLIPLATWNMGKGFPLWEWGPPVWAPYPLYAWAGFLGVVYLFGLVFFLPREFKADTRAQAQRAGLARVGSDESMLPETKYNGGV